MSEKRTPLTVWAVWTLLSMLLVVMLATATLNLVREFNERPVEVYVCSRPGADAECEPTR